MRLTNTEAIETLRVNYPDAYYEQLREAVDAAINALKTQDSAGDTISRQAAIDALAKDMPSAYTPDGSHLADEGIFMAQEIYTDCIQTLKDLPSAQSEPLTDKEQRIFLAAMGREEKVCEEVDRNYVREPYKDSLVKTCHEITRKVKGALWTI